ncbi:type II CAAX endopeptidase family protein [Lactococcus lactis]|uniref:CPBP family intramembrane glutamic endopeptidase n=1 Tax=Lactococcus lactis TaxID=1358 RepID=UPI0035BBFE59
MNLTKTMELTKLERKKNVWLTLFLGILLVIILQGITVIPSDAIKNSGIKDVYLLFSNVFVIAGVIIFCRFFEKRSLLSLGINKNNFFKNLLIGGASAFLFMLFILVINVASGAVDIHSNLTYVSWFYIIFTFLGYFFQGTMEEIVCRGFIMNSFAARYNVGIGIFVNTFIFALLHSLSSSVTPLAIFNIFLVGLVLSLIFYISDNIFLVGAFHAIWNFMLGPVFGVEVSGLRIYSSLIKTETVRSKSMINGGDFGFEGGLAVTILTVIVLILLYFVIKRKTKIIN